MSYVKKTLLNDEKIIVATKYHWVFWFCPVFCLTLPFLLIICTVMAWNDWTLSPFSMTLMIFFALSLIILLLILFIQYISIENVVTNKRVICKTGFIRTDTDELRNEKIENIQIKQSLVGRILGYGNLEFTGTGGSPVIFKLIPNPVAVKKDIENIFY